MYIAFVDRGNQYVAKYLSAIHLVFIAHDCRRLADIYDTGQARQ